MLIIFTLNLLYVQDVPQSQQSGPQNQGECRNSNRHQERELEFFYAKTAPLDKCVAIIDTQS